MWLTCGVDALNGGIPTSNSYRITPTDHQSAVAPEGPNIAEDQSAKCYTFYVNSS